MWQHWQRIISEEAKRYGYGENELEQTETTEIFEDYKETLKGVRKVKVLKPIQFAKLDVGTTYVLMYDTSYMGEPMYKLGADGKKTSGRISGKKIAKAIEGGLIQALKEETEETQFVEDGEIEEETEELTEATPMQKQADFIKGLPAAAVKDIRALKLPSLKGGVPKNIPMDKMEKLTNILKKHKVKLFNNSDYQSAIVIMQWFDTVHKEEVEVSEQFKAGDKVKVPHKGKMVSGKIVRFDDGGTSKAQQHGGGYVVDVGEPASILVPKQKVQKEEAEHSEAVNIVDEGNTAKIGRLQDKIGRILSNIRSGYSTATPEKDANVKRLKKIQADLVAKQEKTNQRRAVAKFPHLDPKIAKMDWEQSARVRGVKREEIEVAEANLTEGPYTVIPYPMITKGLRDAASPFSIQFVDYKGKVLYQYPKQVNSIQALPAHMDGIFKEMRDSGWLLRHGGASLKLWHRVNILDKDGKVVNSIAAFDVPKKRSEEVNHEDDWVNIHESAALLAKTAANEITAKARELGVKIIVQSNTSVSFSKNFTRGSKEEFFKAYSDCDKVRRMVRFKSRVNEWGASTGGIGLGAQDDIAKGVVTIHKSGDGAAYLLKALDKSN